MQIIFQCVYPEILELIILANLNNKTTWPFQKNMFNFTKVTLIKRYIVLDKLFHTHERDKILFRKFRQAKLII